MSESLLSPLCHRPGNIQHRSRSFVKGLLDIVQTGMDNLYTRDTGFMYRSIIPCVLSRREGGCGTPLYKFYGYVPLCVWFSGSHLLISLE